MTVSPQYTYLAIVYRIGLIACWFHHICSDVRDGTMLKLVDSEALTPATMRKSRSAHSALSSDSNYYSEPELDIDTASTSIPTATKANYWFFYVMKRLAATGLNVSHICIDIKNQNIMFESGLACALYHRYSCRDGVAWTKVIQSNGHHERNQYWRACTFLELWRYNAFSQRTCLSALVSKHHWTR